MKNNTKRGFTIIEMVIVIAIIGILSAVLIPTYGNVVGRANESAALQSSRSTMTNWLASSTTSAGVPTSGTDKNGNQYYAAYFEFVNDETKDVYQYRYADGGLERTDDNELWKVNFNGIDRVEKVYLTTPNVDKNFDLEKYAVNIYKHTVRGGTENSINYYIKEGAKSAYSCGGADVYAGTSGEQVFYKAGDGTTADALKSINSWVEDEKGDTGVYGFTDADVTTLDDAHSPTNAAVTFTKCQADKYEDWINTVYTISFNVSGVSGATAAPASLTTDANGKITLPTTVTGVDMSGYEWKKGSANGTAVTDNEVYTANTTLYLGSKTTTPPEDDDQ